MPCTHTPGEAHTYQAEASENCPFERHGYLPKFGGLHNIRNKFYLFAGEDHAFQYDKVAIYWKPSILTRRMHVNNGLDTH
jgi:hypothetical protein